MSVSSQELVDRIARLTRHDGWAAVRERWQTRKEHLQQVVLAQVLAGGPAAKAVDQRFIDYTRGFIDGAEWVLDNPVKATEQLERLLSKQGEDE